MARARGFWLEFPTQAHDVVVDDPVVQGHALAPGGIQQLIAAQHPAAAPHEGGQQLELERAQIDDLPRTAHLAASEVYVNVAELKVSRSASPTRRNAALMRARSSRGLNGLVT